MLATLFHLVNKLTSDLLCLGFDYTTYDEKFETARIKINLKD